MQLAEEEERSSNECHVRGHFLWGWCGLCAQFGEKTWQTLHRNKI